MEEQLITAGGRQRLRARGEHGRPFLSLWRTLPLVACALAALVPNAGIGQPPSPALSSAARSAFALKITSMGDPAMAPLMDAWLSALQSRQPDLRKGSPWIHPSADVAFGALMFELADMAPLAREPARP